MVKRLHGLVAVGRDSLYLCKSTAVVKLGRGSASLVLRRRRTTAPLGRRPVKVRRLNGLRVHILGDRCLVRHATLLLTGAEDGETGFDMNVGGVKLGGSLVGIESIGSLVVTRLVLTALVEARNEPARTYKVPRSYQTSEMLGFSLMAREVSVEGIAILMDLIIQDSIEHQNVGFRPSR